MRQQFYRGLLIFLGILTFFGYAEGASASVKTYQVPYTVQKFKTKQTSVADAYFVKPAKVTVLSNTYEVTLDIVTSQDLGKYPVKILLINGQYPKVTKKVVGKSYQYQIKFSVTKIAKPVIGTMQVDIDNLNYHHKYSFNIAFNTKKLPKLKLVPTATNTTAAKKTNVAASSSSNRVTPSNEHTSKKKVSQKDNKVAKNKTQAQAKHTNKQLLVVGFATLSAIVGLAYARSLLK